MRGSAEHERFFVMSVDLLCVAAADGHLLQVNPAWERTLGHAVAELRARPFTDLVHPEDVTATLSELGRLRQGAVTASFENRYRCRDGTYRWLSWTWQRDEDGTLLGAARDTTAERERDARRDDEASVLRAILDTVGDPIFVKDDEHRIILVNRAFCDALGLDEPSVLGRTLTEHVPEDERRHFLDIDREVLDSGVTNVTEESLTFAGRSTRTIITRKARFVDSSGGRFLVGSIHDITEERRAQGDLRARASQMASLAEALTMAEQRARRDLALLIHDDLQQSLVAARIQLEHVLPELPSQTLPAGHRVARILEESLATARTLSRELSPPIAESKDLAGALRWLARFTEDRHQLAVEVEVRGLAGSPAEAKATLVYTAARELLLNVVKHSGARQAALSLVQADGFLVLRVTDGGVGFDPAAVTARTVDIGFGLLSIRERTDLVGGTLSLETAPGRGVVAEVRIPLSTGDRPTAAMTSAVTDSAPPARPVERTDGGMGPGVRIVLADDHATVREGLVSVLSAEPGFMVVGQASNGWEALECVALASPDVVLMDVSMPLMDGVEATRRLKARAPHVRVIGLSMHDDPTVIARLREAGADRYLTKGAPLTQLIATIRGCVLPAERGSQPVSAPAPG